MHGNTRRERKQIPLHPTAKIVKSPPLILHWQQWGLFPLQLCSGNGTFQPDLMSLHYPRAHSRCHVAPHSTLRRDERQRQKQDKRRSEKLLPARIVCSGPVPYRCGDTVSVPGATSSSANPDIWHWISSHRVALTVKFMNGNYQSMFLVPFTTYVFTEN